MITVFIVDDHAVVIEGLSFLLQDEKEIKVIGRANNAEGCLSFFSMQPADVILMDISMPGINGIDLCAMIKEKYPNTMVLALSTFDQGSYIRRMVDNGASGYLLKNAGKKEIVDAIKLVVQGKTYFSYDAVQSMKSDTQKMKSFPRLTKREKEVLALIVEGLTNAQMGERLFISADTVDSHRKNLHLKLNVNNTAMLVRVALENNLV